MATTTNNGQMSNPLQASTFAENGGGIKWKIQISNHHKVSYEIDMKWRHDEKWTIVEAI